MEIKDIISSGLLELYASALTSQEETQQVQQWIRQYPEVAAELNQIEEGLEAYAFANAIQPDDSVKEKLFAKINFGQETKIVSLNKGTVQATTPMYWKWAAAASIILLFGSLLVNFLIYNKYTQTQQSLAGLQNESNQMKEDMHVVQSKYSQPVSLHGLDAAPDAAAKIFWMKNTGEVFIDPSNLPDAPEGKQYQLWAIVDGKPVDGGMILTSNKGDKYRIQKMKTFGKAEAFAVTLESEKGNQSPKGPMYVMGKM